MSDEEIIKGIINNDNNALNYIYKTFFPLIKWKLVKNITFNEADAWDIFQDAMMILFNILKKQNGNINCSIKTFIFSVCKNLVAKKFEILKTSPEIIKIGLDELLAEKIWDTDFKILLKEDEVERNMKIGIIQRHLRKLGKECRKILLMYARGILSSEITIKKEYKFKEYARKKKHLCMGILKESIKKDKLFIYLQNKKDER